MSLVGLIEKLDSGDTLDDIQQPLLLRTRCCCVLLRHYTLYTGTVLLKGVSVLSAPNLTGFRS